MSVNLRGLASASSGWSRRITWLPMPVAFLACFTREPSERRAARQPFGPLRTLLNVAADVSTWFVIDGESLTTWLIIEGFGLSCWATIAAFWFRARRRGITRERSAVYRRSFWGLSGLVLLTAARITLHKYR
jgi:hypothetical protein